MSMYKLELNRRFAFHFILPLVYLAPVVKTRSWNYVTKDVYESPPSRCSIVVWLKFYAWGGYGNWMF